MYFSIDKYTHVSLVRSFTALCLNRIGLGCFVWCCYLIWMRQNIDVVTIRGTCIFLFGCYFQIKFMYGYLWQTPSISHSVIHSRTFNHTKVFSYWNKFGLLPILCASKCEEGEQNTKSQAENANHMLSSLLNV